MSENIGRTLSGDENLIKLLGMKCSCKVLTGI